MSLEIEGWLASSTTTTRSTSASTQGWPALFILHDSLLDCLEDVNLQITASSTSAGIPQKRVRFDDDDDDVAHENVLDDDLHESLSRLYLELREFSKWADIIRRCAVNGKPNNVKEAVCVHTLYRILHTTRIAQRHA